MLTFECHMLQHLISFVLVCIMQVRPRFAKDPLFDTITEEVERVRLFKEFMKTVKVGNMCGKISIVPLLQFLKQKGEYC